MGFAEEMTGIAPELTAQPPERRRDVIARSTIIAVIAFLTLIDLFGSQALLPVLVDRYGVSPGAMGFAVNASTIGMAAASLIVAIFARRIDRRRGIWMCLALLSVPTVGLAFADDLTTFTLLRIAQGVFMAAAFTLTLTYLSEICTTTAIGGAMAAYITGNVASNLFGRLMASELAGTLGVAESFIGFAVLNLTGALLAYRYFGGRSEEAPEASTTSVLTAWADHARNLRLWGMIAMGFALLFVFVAAFTYANFILASDAFGLPQASIGLVYFVFAPAILTTPAAAYAVARLGARTAFRTAIAVSLIGLGFLLTSWLPAFLTGLALLGAGLFFAQSVATASIGRTVSHDHAAANGLYLASYYLGGLAGAWLIGQVFETAGWGLSVAILLAVTAVAGLLAGALPRRAAP
ncbi:MAG: MFS transporter [Pseudomonadota bacterium]